MKNWYEKHIGPNATVERIGELDITIPDVPSADLIDYAHLPRTKQRWQRIEEPTEFRALTVEEKKAHWYVKREYHRKKHGYWFMNNGRPTYITGAHYTYLQWWKIKGSIYPEYRSSDRKFFLFWDYAQRDDKCLGVLYFTNRREGKTAKAAFLNFYFTSGVKNAHGGIQSKDDQGGEMVFRSHVIKAIKALPDWMRPLQSGSEDPKGKELAFFEPAEQITRKKLKEGQTFKKQIALDSKITYGPSTETYYDGEELNFYHCDEVGKVDRIDAVNRHDIVVPCLMKGKNIVGKALYTTTVEDVGKNALKNARTLWDDSDPNKRDENGYTTSKLYRLFKPAYDGLEGFVDEYGDSMEDEARKYILAERDALKKDGKLKKWAGQVRKFPIDPSEPFTPNAQDCFFDVGRLSARKDELQTMTALKESPVVRGNLVWADNLNGGWMNPEDRGDNSRLIKGDVIFIPSDNGKFLRSIPPKNPNNTYADYDGLHPGNVGIYSAGIDPFDFSETTDNRASKGSGAVFIHPNPSDPVNTDRWAMIYVHRPELNTEFYEDMVKMLVYYGCKGVVERNKVLCRNYIANRGFEDFIYGKLKLDPTEKAKASDNIAGEYTGRTHLVSITDAFESYIYESYQKIDFIELIDQLFGWSIADSNKYDLVIAAGFALLAARYAKHRVEDPITPNTRQAVQQWFTVYDYAGNQSIRR